MNTFAAVHGVVLCLGFYAFVAPVVCADPLMVHVFRCTCFRFPHFHGMHDLTLPPPSLYPPMGPAVGGDLRGHRKVTVVTGPPYGGSSHTLTHPPPPPLPPPPGPVECGERLNDVPMSNFEFLFVSNRECLNSLKRIAGNKCLFE